LQSQPPNLAIQFADLPAQPLYVGARWQVHHVPDRSRDRIDPPTSQPSRASDQRRSFVRIRHYGPVIRPAATQCARRRRRPAANQVCRSSRGAG
jgi:hypothetical protein